MGIREVVVEWLNGVPKGEAEERANRAFEAGFYEAFDGNDDPASGDIAAGGFGYRRVTAGHLRDFSLMTPDDILDTVWTLWQSSPLAKRILTMKRDHIIGRGTTPTTPEDEEALAEIVDDFWTGNKLPDRASEFALQLFLLGEQVYPAFVRQADGRVRLGYIDPGEIDRVIHHPDNALEPWAVVIKAQESSDDWRKRHEKRVYRIIRQDEEHVAAGANGDEEVVPPAHEGRFVMAGQANLEPWEETMLRAYDLSEYTGSCFYVKVNSVSNQARGKSDLVQVADWIDQADETLFGMAEREQFAGYFAFDVLLEGWDPNTEEGAREANRIRRNPPKRGSVNVHNEREEWEVWAPDLKQVGSIAAFRAMLGFILGGVGYPVHWFGFGDDANRATALAQGDPTEKTLEHDQGIVKDMLLMLIRFAIDQAIIAGAPVEDAPVEDIDLPLPEVTTRDMTKITSALGSLALALTAFVDNGWLTRETAVKLLAKVAAELGVEIDPAQEIKAVDKEQERLSLEREQQRNDALQQAMSGQNGTGDTGDTVAQDTDLSEDETRDLMRGAGR